VDLLFRLAPLHDIGKVGVRDRILLKPARLTPEEYEEMKRHTLYGSETIRLAKRMLGEDAFFQTADDLVLNHHERWDGTGYPNGLRGEAIPLPGRLMAVADAYDAIIVPNQGRGGKGLVFDREPQRKPLAYTKSEQFKSHGMYGESEDITGGMGLQGVLEFQKFVESGGLVVTLGQASFFPPEFGLTRKIDAGRPSPQFYAPGPIVEAEILQPQHPIFYGYTQKTIPVRYANGPLLNVPERDREQQKAIAEAAAKLKEAEALYNAEVSKQNNQ